MEEVEKQAFGMLDNPQQTPLQVCVCERERRRYVKECCAQLGISSLRSLE